MTLDEAVKHFGSTAALAAALDLKERTVEKWTELDRRTQLAIQTASHGKLKADKS